MPGKKHRKPSPHDGRSAALDLLLEEAREAEIAPARLAALEALREHLLEFPDNRLLIELCGEYDRNLAEIEQKDLFLSLTSFVLKMRKQLKKD